MFDLDYKNTEHGPDFGALIYTERNFSQN